MSQPRTQCHYCLKPLSKDFTWDHIVPRAAGGTSHETNLVPACGNCNRLKAASVAYREHCGTCRYSWELHSFVRPQEPIQDFPLAHTRSKAALNPRTRRQGRPWTGRAA